ncbi:MAG: HAD family hydrolase [Granulosicoccus sp.]
MKYSAVVFDMDGLLIDSEKPALQTFLSTCKQFDLTDSDHLYTRLLGTNQAATQRILESALGSQIDISAFIEQWETRYQAAIEQGVALMPGVGQLLSYLEHHGIPKAVATSTSSDKALGKLDKAGLLDRFVSVTGGDQVNAGKPAPDLFLAAAISLQTTAGQCIALEDSPNGVRAAVAAGMHTIQIPDLVQPDDDLLKLGHAVLPNLQSVPDYLQSLP